MVLWVLWETVFILRLCMLKNFMLKHLIFKWLSVKDR